MKKMILYKTAKPQGDYTKKKMILRKKVKPQMILKKKVAPMKSWGSRYA